MQLLPAPIVPGFTEPVPDFNTQSDDVFADNAQRMVNELPPFHSGLGQMAAWINTAATGITEDADGVNQNVNLFSELLRRSEALANFKGDWSALVGAYVVATSVRHVNKFWMLLGPVADIAAHEPGVSPVWIDLSQTDGFGTAAQRDAVTGPLDATPNRLTDVAYDFKAAADRREWLNHETSGRDIDFLQPGDFGLFNPALNPGLYPPGVTVHGWLIDTVLTHGVRYQYARSFLTYTAELLPEIWVRACGYNATNFVGAEWVPVTGGKSKSTTVEPVISLPVPVRSAEIFVGGSLYKVIVDVDLNLGNVFAGYSTTTTAALPPGELVPQGMLGVAGFLLEFNFLNVPAENETMIKYLRWAGFLRAGSGGGSVSFALPVGWTVVWASGSSAGSSTPVALSPVNGSAASAVEELQLIFNHASKRLTISYGGWI